MRIEFQNNLTGDVTRAILHRELEDGSIVVSYVADAFGANGGQLRRYRTLSPWHFSGIKLAPKKVVVMGEPAVDHVRTFYTDQLANPHTTTVRRMYANCQLNLIFAAYNVE